MITLSGPATHCQHTVKVTRGGNSPASTQYIQFFRINGQQVTFQSSQAISIAEGDEMVAAGVMKDSGMTAYAVRNVSTGAAVHIGVINRIIVAVFMVFFGLFFTKVLVSIFGSFFSPAFLIFIGISLFQIYQAFMAKSAMQQVQSYVRA